MDRQTGEGEGAALPPEHEPAFNLPGVIVVLAAICIVLQVVRDYFLDLDQNIAVMLYGAFIPVRYSGLYAIDLPALTTPLTYSFLHGDFVHLGVNLVWLAAFGPPLANRIGTARFLLFWAATSVAAAFAFAAFNLYTEAPLVGASGAISGMMGAAARFGFTVDRTHRRSAFVGRMLGVAEALANRKVLTFLGVWFAVNLATGLLGAVPGVDARIAWESHIGGFLLGFLGTRLFDRRTAA